MESDTPRTPYERPANRFVAEFIGEATPARRVRAPATDSRGARRRAVLNSARAIPRRRGKLLLAVQTREARDRRTRDAPDAAHETA